MSYLLLSPLIFDMIQLYEKGKKDAINTKLRYEPQYKSKNLKWININVYFIVLLFLKIVNIVTGNIGNWYLTEAMGN